MNFYPYQNFQPWQGYQQPQQMQPMPQIPDPRQQSGGPIWVQGEAGAKAYMVPPGGTAILMDNDRATFYMKSCDQQGRPSMRIFDFTERMEAQGQPEPGSDKYVTREEFQELVRRLGADRKGKYQKEDNDE